MMSETRSRILQAVRAGLGAPRRDAASIAAEAAALLAAPEQIRPKLPDKPLEEIFADRLLQPHMGATLDRIAALGELPDTIRRYLSQHDLQPAIALQPAPQLLALEWSGIEVHRELAADEPAGVGIAWWGIAETGSLVFHSGSDAPTLLNFLPLHHIVALDARSILANLEDYATVAEKTGTPPRNVNIITGASGTTDIEGSYVRGAHGPRFLHVVLIGSSS